MVNFSLKKKKLNILFRTSGGRAVKKQLGLGHVYRCINLAKYLKNCGIFFLIEDYGGAEQVIKNNSIKNIYKIKKNITLQSDLKQTINHILKKKIDLLVVDKYNTNLKYCRELKKYTKIVVISDLKKINFPADLVVNGFIGFENKTITNKYNTKSLLGPAFQILNKKYEKMKISKTKNHKLLVTFGGFDEHDIVEIFIDRWLKFKHKIKTKIILGPVTYKSKKVKKLQKRYKKYLTIVNHVSNMPKEIASVEFGLCSGGITTYEFARLGVPFAIICQVNHQLITAKEWERKRIAMNIGLVDRKIRKKIDMFLQLIEKNKFPYTANKKLVDGKGTRRIVQEIIKIK